MICAPWIAKDPRDLPGDFIDSTTFLVLQLHQFYVTWLIFVFVFFLLSVTMALYLLHLEISDSAFLVSNLLYY